MALQKDRVLIEKMIPHSPEFGHSVAQGFRVFRGALVMCLADGTIVPAGTASPPAPAVGVIGIAVQRKDNMTAGAEGGISGSDPIWVKNGCYALPFDIVPTWADLGKSVYAIDDEKVSLTETPDGGTSRLRAGILAGFELDGTPYVTIG